MYDAVILHGLLQTNEYASPVIRAVSVGERADVIEQRVAGWMVRQAVRTREGPPQLCFVLDESVLLRPAGGADVMRRQLMHLVEVSEWLAITSSWLRSTGTTSGATGRAWTRSGTDTPEPHFLNWI